MSKQALTVGINHYRIPGNDLRGCVNDSNNLTRTLRGRGFEVTQLLNDQATATAIGKGIDALVAAHNAAIDRRERPVSLFHFAGHGSQVPDESWEEVDGSDEVLVPYDCDWNSRVICDDYIADWFSEIRPGGQFVVLMDCCHSGTNTRSLTWHKEHVERYLPSPYALVAAEVGTRAGGVWRRIWRLFRGDEEHGPGDAVVFAACRDDQTAVDAVIDGQHQGAQTWAFVKALGEQHGSLALLHSRVEELVAAAGFDQQPQLHGSRELIGERVLI